MNNPVPQIPGELDGLGKYHLACRLPQRDIARCRHHIVAAPVIDFVGTHHPSALGDLDIAGGDDRIGGPVVNHLVGGHQEIARHQITEIGRSISLLRPRLQRAEGHETRENERREGLHHAVAIRPQDGTGPRRQAK